MPAPTTIEEFLDLVRKSGVIDEKRLSAQLDRLRSSGQMITEPGKFAGLLVRDGILTHFQAEQFLQGKWRRFTIGKYKVLERLGAGGMGSVYLCEHMLMRRRVAVKVLPATKAEDSSSLERFYREARAVAALDHPNIVRAYDIDQDDKLHFLVMEHVDGASLQEMIKRSGPMDVLRAAHYIRQAALGLQHAHESAGLVHRDIKPGNILVDRNGIVKVLDMGLARFFHDDEDNLTKKFDENVLGTADYLAPEQALDSHGVDIRADIYSLGGTFYYCLTGRTPFTEGSVAQKLIWHQTRQPKKVREFRPDVPDGIVAILEKMMAKDPVGRYQTPQDLADALAPLTQMPIPPPPDNEMPTFSLAATQSLNPGEASMMAARNASEPPGGKSWQLNSSNIATSTITPAPTATAARAPNFPTPRPAPSTVPTPLSPAPIASAPAPAVSRPLPPALPSPRPAAAPAPVSPPPRPAAPPVQSRSAPTAPVPAPVETFSTGPAARETYSPVPRPEQAHQASRTPETEPYQTQVESEVDHHDEETEEQFSAPSSDRRRRSVDISKKKSLPLLLGIGGGVLLVGVGFLVYFLKFSGPAPVTVTKPPPRVTIRVPGGQPGALNKALLKARDGDRFVVDGNLTEVDLRITKPNVTIEAAPGRTIICSYPATLDAAKRMLVVENVPNFHMIGITFDGLGKASTLIEIYGKCHGTRIEKVHLQNPGKFGVHFFNCAGTAESPVLFEKGTIATSKPTDSAIRFDFLESFKDLPKQNAHISFSQMTFSGQGHKASTANPAWVNLKTIEFPSPTPIETIP